MFEMSKGRPGELLLSALVRARFAELLGSRIKHGGADLFLLGVLSMMDAILELPMTAVIQGLPLDENARQLLLEHDGPLAGLYRLVSEVEAGAWNLVVRSCAELGVAQDFAASCYSDAMAWAQSLAASV
jgi:EAL and modified HD-GYP domain-containing signal transduction protein